ncbi:MAG TPA: hypothetical protein VFG54_19150, partial [Prolixibacteraceae bacterium]|nr:hypothetical protein [Prolixibacteraceae bacterium]
MGTLKSILNPMYLPGAFRYIRNGDPFKRISFLAAFTALSLMGFSQSEGKKPVELWETLKRFPTINEFLINSVYEAKVVSSEKKAVYRFTDTVAHEPVYVAWS